jgi:hypothetical protein
MRFSLPDGQTVRIDQSFVMDEIQYPSNWIRSMTVSERMEFGAIELPEDPVPESAQYVLTPMDEIRNLEASVTPRRIREAVLTEEGKIWLANIEAQIAVLRQSIPPSQETSQP